MENEVKQEHIRFSVIIAAYNIEEYIQRALESAANQTLKNIEIIVVNDASTDNTKQKILEMQEKYDNIIYLEHEKNKKAGGARNTGLAIAKGEYIVFLDGDDYLAENDVLERLDKVIGNDIVDVTYLGFKIEGDREELVLPTPETCTKTFKAAVDKYPNPWSKCWRKAYLDENGIRFKEGIFYEDVLFVYSGVMKSKTTKIADFVVHKYTSGRVNSMTTTVNLKNIEDTISNLNDLLKMRQTEYTPEIDIIIKKEVRMCKKRLDNVLIGLYGKEEN
ncbi:MAG: glycosyltransferase family 2 protein [Clostridia bacterium]|nr:glycosyltransferase family 2 protein [Clostridia bacterium]